MNTFGLKLQGDKVIWIIYLVLAMVSLAVVYSASGYLAYKQEDTSALQYLFKQMGIVLAGFIVMYLVHRIKYSYFSLGGRVAIWIVIPILLLTILLGTNINNASRWLMIPGINMSFQSSDFAKIVLLTYLAKSLSKLPDITSESKGVLQYVILHIFAPTLLICTLILQSNLSTAMLIFVSSLFMMVIGGVRWKYLMVLSAGGIVIIAFVFLFFQRPQ